MSPSIHPFTHATPKEECLRQTSTGSRKVERMSRRRVLVVRERLIIAPVAGVFLIGCPFTDEVDRVLRAPSIEALSVGGRWRPGSAEHPRAPPCFVGALGVDILG